MLSRAAYLKNLFVFILLGMTVLACACTPDPTTRMSGREIDRIRNIDRQLEDERRELAELHFAGGMAAFSQGEMAEAYQHFKRATGMMPDWDLPWLQLAILHPLWDNDRQAELAALERAVAINPENPRTHVTLGAVLMDMGRREAAEDHFLAALARRPEYENARLRLANLYRDMERPEAAIDQYEWLIARHPSNAFYNSILAALYERTGNIEGAERHLRRLIGLQDNPAWVYVKLARFYERNGLADKARQALDHAQKLTPDEQRGRMRPLLPSRR